MPPNGDRFSLQTSRVSQWIMLTDEHVYSAVSANVTLLRVVLKLMKLVVLVAMMVWGGIAHSGKTHLVIVYGNLNDQKYGDDILAAVVLPFHEWW